MFRQIVLQLSKLEKVGGAELIDVTLYYIVNAGQHGDLDDLKKIVREELSQQAEEKFMTIAEQLTQKGLEQGMEKGLLQAQQRIAKELLREGMEPKVVAKVTQLSQSEVEGIQV